MSILGVVSLAKNDKRTEYDLHEYKLQLNSSKDPENDIVEYTGYKGKEHFKEIYTVYDFINFDLTYYKIHPISEIDVAIKNCELPKKLVRKYLNLRKVKITLIMVKPYLKNIVRKYRNLRKVKITLFMVKPYLKTIVRKCRKLIKVNPFLKNIVRTFKNGMKITLILPHIEL